MESMYLHFQLARIAREIVVLVRRDRVDQTIKAKLRKGWSLTALCWESEH